MTTDLQLTRANDLFVENEVFNLGWLRDVPTPRPVLGGAAWILGHTSPAVAHFIAISAATARVMSNLDGHALFLLAGIKVDRPDSAVTRYRNLKLWGVLQAAGFLLPEGNDLGEYPVTIKGDPHYFGALQLRPGPLEATSRILDKISLAVLVALHPQQSALVNHLIQSGWQPPREGGPSWSILEAVCGSDGVVFWPVGAFDDPESGVVALAKPSLIERILDEPTDSR